MSSVVVTGAGRGIGRAIARRLAGDGWHVVGLERDGEAAAELERELGADGAVLVGDASARETLDAAAALAASVAPLGGWVNNAGLCPRGTNLHGADAETVERVFALNLGGTFWGCAAAVRTFVAQGSGGAIVNLSSLHGQRSYVSHPEYDATKAAVEGLTRSVAVAYGQIGVRANAIAPGAVRTPMYEEGVLAAGGDSSFQERAAPLRRVGEPDEIAAAARFLLSDEASFVTGQVLAVDGGWSVALAAPPLDPLLSERFGLA